MYSLYIRLDIRKSSCKKGGKWKENTNGCCFIFKSPREKKSKTVLHFGFHAMDSGSMYWSPDSLSVELGFRILSLAGFRIPKPRIPGLHEQKFPGSRIPQVGMFNNYYSSLNGLWVNSGRMGYWLKGHEGERNNYFSKIQLVGQKYREQKIFSYLKLDFNPFFRQKAGAFRYYVGYNI